jgi:pimeloyl-ACP methyl ester carboxylesterase
LDFFGFGNGTCEYTGNAEVFQGQIGRLRWNRFNALTDVHVAANMHGVRPAQVSPNEQGPVGRLGDLMSISMQLPVPIKIKSNGLELCAGTFGDKSAPAIVLVMGLGAQMIAWPEPFCEALSANGFFVVRFDNRDIGQSQWLPNLGVPNTVALMGDLTLGRPITTPYALKDMAADTTGVMDAFGIERAHIVGASMGGMIGQELTIHYGNRLRTLTSIMSTTGDPRLPQAAPEAAAVLFTPAPMDHDGYVKHLTHVYRVLRGPHFPEEAADDGARAERVFARGVNPAGVARQFAAILASGNRTAALSRVTTPTLVLHGDADPLVRIEGGRATAAAIPGAKFEVLPSMGHSLPRALWPRIIDAVTMHARAH